MNSLVTALFYGIGYSNNGEDDDLANPDSGESMATSRARWVMEHIFATKAAWIKNPRANLSKRLVPRARFSRETAPAHMNGALNDLIWRYTGDNIHTVDARCPAAVRFYPLNYTPEFRFQRRWSFSRTVTKKLILPEMGSGESDIARAMNACTSYTRYTVFNQSLVRPRRIYYVPVRIRAYEESQCGPQNECFHLPFH